MKEAFQKAIEKSREEGGVDNDFLNQLEDAIKRSKESNEPIIESREKEREVIHHTEEIVSNLSPYEQTLGRWLKRYGVTAEVRKLPDGTFEVPFRGMPTDIPELPAQYGYKGGAARAILRHSLGLVASKPRDLDIIYTGEKENKDLSAYLAEKYMPEDYANGHGVERLENNYFSTRDFTINEVMFDGQRVICTKECLMDELRGIVRFSGYEMERSAYDDGFISPKLAAKAVRIIAELEEAGTKAKIDSGSLPHYVDDFHMSLHLDRAIQKGLGVAQKYVDIMRERGYLPDKIRSPRAAFKYLIGRTDFVFRNAPPRDMESERTFLEELATNIAEQTPLSPVQGWKR